jgi:two-component system NtrC family sensor kinase
VKPFAEQQIELVKTFADQAVIAIENVRLFDEVRARTKELAESLEQQTATSEVLQVISSSPGELEPVFQAMLENATRICDAKFGILDLCEGDALPGSNLDCLARTKQVVHVTDVLAGSAYDQTAIVGLAGARTVLIIPMLKESKLIGGISIYRQEVQPFTDKQIELVNNFAKQAVIAIENTRLLNELRQRTDDLSEALEQQTATSEVLQVISNSPGELDPVFNAALTNATRICEAKFGMMFRFDGEAFHFAAEVGTPREFAEFERQRGPFLSPPGSPLEHVMRTKQVYHSPDISAEGVPNAATRLGAARSAVVVPLLKESALIGVIAIFRQEARPFTGKQIEHDAISN